jgi:hypothetical protein
VYLARIGYTAMQKAPQLDTGAIPARHSMASIEATQQASAEKHIH